tara:strand:- start:567 stop:668 length:102 start_codon:yes stop_codon:yes gene_type:complete
MSEHLINMIAYFAAGAFLFGLAALDRWAKKRGW